MNSKINIFSIWLLSLMTLICAIILIGGYTRISDSGLSITEWLPVSGVLYPLSEAAWNIEFDKYKLIDEFMLVNSSMTLQEFKVIYFWEWFHRAFARLIGAAYLIPLCFLLFYKKIDRKYYVNIISMGVLLFAQAVIGWYMVKSGLSERVDVSQYRLALHLTMAFIILGLIFYTLVSYLFENDLINNNSVFIKKYKSLLIIIFIFICLQISYGAFVSGTHSGLIYNTWPLYNGNILPFFENTQIRWLINFFENGEYIIFIHRTFAMLILVILFYLNYLIIINKLQKKYFSVIVFFNITFILQIILGVSMTYLNIPWHLALLHQGNSILVFLLSFFMYILSTKSPQ
ncbi:COX15/CtaA family protein [Pelagibacteraceae bacterium]|nr:COX15/CtaA family protein [Pelagibacteraceae bacterium]